MLQTYPSHPITVCWCCRSCPSQPLWLEMVLQTYPSHPITVCCCSRSCPSQPLWLEVVLQTYPSHPITVCCCSRSCSSQPLWLEVVLQTLSFPPHNSMLLLQELSLPASVVRSVPHSKSEIVPRSSLLGAGRLGFWEVGKGGTIG